MLSVVCAYNNERLLADCLLRSLDCQKALFELIAVDNTKNKFKSASEALNHGAARARGKYVVFVHQDVCLSGNAWLDDAETMLSSLPNLGVAGIAAKSEDDEILTNVTHLIPPKPAGTKTLQEPVKVQAVDECLIVVPRTVFDEVKFDEVACDGWHLYAVDYCLSCAELGFETYVLPLSAYHRSTGGTLVPAHVFDRLVSALSRGAPTVPSAYYRSLKKVLKKHKKQTSKVYTVFGVWRTTYPLALQRLLILMKRNLRKICHRFRDAQSTL
jgi:GT2 family glycosyltransferase